MNINYSALANVKFNEEKIDTGNDSLALKNIKRLLNKTLKFRDGRTGSTKLENGYFASLIQITPDVCLAFSTDGVGTKLLVAQMMEKYDTIGIDCVAMNVNDVICLGAEPISMLDYIAVESINESILEEIAKGLYKGAEIANISIPGGELSQMGDMIKGVKENKGFDLVGMCIGVVPTNKIIVGNDIVEGDIILGLSSSGIHSNGLTLARKIFFDKMGFNVDKYIPELNRTLGEELLEPTHIYVPEILELIKSGINIKALINITSEGLLNLLRINPPFTYIIDYLPKPQPIFELIQYYGDISDESMFYIYNMGIGFCMILSETDYKHSINILKKYGISGYRIGFVSKSKVKKVLIESKNMTGEIGGFYKKQN